MEQKNKKQKKIAARTVAFVMISCIVLGITTILTGLIIYSNTLQDVFVSKSRDTAVRAATAVHNGGDTAGLAGDIMKVYNSLTQDERSRTGTEEYRDCFRSIESVSSPDGAGSELKNILENYRTDVSAIYLCALDSETNVLICLANASEDSDVAPGDWLEIPADWARQIADNTDPDGSDVSALCFFTDLQGAGKECFTVYPVPVESRNTAGTFTQNPVCLITELPITSVNEKVIRYTLRVSSIALLFTLLIAFIAGWYMKKSVASPVNAIAGAAAAYVHDKKNDSACQDHFSSIGIHTGDELENLVGVMAGMEADLAMHEEELKKVTADKERIRTELVLARQIQTGALPDKFPPFPDRKEFELFAAMDPAKEVGGDFYDFFLIDDDHLALVIADVSGKGIPAALFMMVARSLIKNQLLGGCDPAQALAKANNQICGGNTSSTFVTVWLAIVQISTGKGVACNAGHENPCLRRCREPYEMLKYKHNISVGVMENIKYRNREFELYPGDSIFVYTDGVPEAINMNDEMFGEERLIETLNRDPDASPEELTINMRKAVDAFAEDAPQYDDLTMLAFRYNGPDKGKA